MIVYSFFHLYTSYFSTSPEGRLWTCYTFLILDMKMGSTVCTLFVHDCIRLFSFVHLLLFYLPWWGWERGHATLFDFGFENGLNRLYMIVYVCRPLTFLPLPGGGLGTCNPPFLILDSKMDSIVYISFVHDCIQLFSFIHLILFYLSWGWGAVDMLHFFDFGFESGFNRLYFDCT